MAMFDLHHRFLDDFTHVILNPLQVGQEVVAALHAVQLSPPGLDQPARLMPALVSLRDLDRSKTIELIDDAIQWQQDYGRPYFSACLVGKASTQRIFHHLSHRLLLGSPGRQRFLLRFTDPRVFSQITGILDAAQVDALMGPIEQWHWVDITNTVRQRIRQREPHAVFHVRPEQLPPLQRVGLVNTCLLSIRRAGQEIKDPVTLGRHLDAALIDAKQRFGLDDDEDRCLYAIQSAVMGMPADSHPLLTEALRRVGTREISYVGACAALTDDPLGVPPMAPRDDRPWEIAK